MNFKIHFEQHPELVDQEFSAKLRARPISNTPKNYESLKKLANACFIPNSHRNTFVKLSDLIGQIADRIGWALDIQNKGLAVGDTVTLNSSEKIKIKSIAIDYSIRLEGKSGAYNPKRLTKV